MTARLQETDKDKKFIPNRLLVVEMEIVSGEHPVFGLQKMCFTELGRFVRTVIDNNEVQLFKTQDGRILQGVVKRHLYIE